MAQFKMFKPFNIDNGELDGLTAQECFVLGYELAEIQSLLQLPAEFQKPVHADNRLRIEQFVADSGRQYRLDWMQDDPSESWMFLAVAPMEPDHNSGSADAA